ncbi:MAG TPA: Xaa-Pro peptidase family protein [Pelolinea sp.]|nr:Xaa-Pro peptidase family protein [Pelolinea sp.]
MRSDLDAIMKEQNIDALWVMGAMNHNADMVYFTGVHEVKQADLFKQVGKPPVVYHFADMERDEAAKSGLETRSFDAEKPLDIYLKKYKGNLSKAVAQRIKDVFSDLGLVKGRVAVSGTYSLHVALALIDELRELLPEIEFFSYFKDNPIQQARMTKEPEEADRICSMGQITTEAIGRVAEYLTSQKTEKNRLVDKDSNPIRIKDIKSKINLWLAELGAENPEETIFAIGRDAGIPHSNGNPEDMIEIGKPIVFDIFPCERGGGYFYDFTRTWCLGFATEEMIHLHQQVLDVHHKIIEELKPGKLLKDYQARTCQLFTEMGHQTVAEQYNLTEGYVHSVSHGLGLDVHENPFSGITAKESDLLIPGVVFSIEPGLYYPSKGIGVRIEDTVYLNPEGQFEIMANYPYDLVLPMKSV